MAAARKGVGLPFAVFAGAVGMSAYVWSQQSPERKSSLDARFRPLNLAEGVSVAYVLD